MFLEEAIALIGLLLDILLVATLLFAAGAAIAIAT